MYLFDKHRFCKIDVEERFKVVPSSAVGFSFNSKRHLLRTLYVSACVNAYGYVCCRSPYVVCICPTCTVPVGF